jgi:hypothetical protein
MEEPKVRVTKHCIPGVILIPKDGYWQIRQVGLTGQRVKKDPVFKRTRQHAKELAQVSRTGKLICDALLPGTNIRKVMPRLISLLMNAIQSDNINIRGRRNLLNGNWQSLEGFEFNEATTLQQALALQATITRQPALQQVTITIPPLIPASKFPVPPGVTHCRIFAKVASLDVTAHTAVTNRQRTTLIPVKHILIPKQTLLLPVGNANDRLNLLAIGIEWYTPSSGKTICCLSDIPAALAVIAVWLCE